MKIIWSDATINDKHTNDVGVNTTTNNPCNSKQSTPLPDVHHSEENSTSASDSNHSEEGGIDVALNLNAGNLESWFPNIIFV